MILWSSTLVALCTLLRAKELGVSGQTWSLGGAREAEGTVETTRVRFLEKTVIPICAASPNLAGQ